MTEGPVHVELGPAGSSEPDLERRALVTGLTAALLSTLVLPAAAQGTADVARSAFLELSRILTGRSALDPTQAVRLYDALSANSPRFQSEVHALLALIKTRSVDPSQLQHTLDTEKSALVALPRAILSAWYTGVVGEGERARCVAFETSLMYVVLADRLTPPSYCHGGPASWIEKPE
jgi:Membrane bound FAD containing D-sorbitol dehydrogenase